jgi:hypothetical protein
VTFSVLEEHNAFNILDLLTLEDDDDVFFREFGAVNSATQHRVSQHWNLQNTTLKKTQTLAIVQSF